MHCFSEAFLGSRSARNDQDRGKAFVLGFGAFARTIAVVGSKLCAQRAWPDGPAVELEKETTLGPTQVNDAVPIRSHATVSAGGCVAPLHQPATGRSPSTGCDCSKHCIRAQRVP